MKVNKLKKAFFVVFVFLFVFTGVFFWYREQANTLNYDLIAAAQKGNLADVQKLLNNGAQVNSKFGGDGETALHRAATLGHNQVVKYLLSKGANVNAKDDIGTTALIMASYHGHLETARILLNAGADINAYDNRYRFTSLHEAARKGHLQVVQLLIASGADTSLRTTDGMDALSRAEAAGHKEIADIIRNSKNRLKE